jgi:DNA (cytosine-5)-methyltransferase 1
VKYLSVCSGIEAASVAWHPLGWEPVAFSEIEKFPSAVLAHHYPAVPNLGDMTKFKEWPDEPINLLVGGTPCQSFSVAGLRKGLADPRGNLMLTYGAIAKRYCPEWLVWENVPGVLSSNGGQDFGTFLGMLAELGYGFAYRILDAQYFGVAQRRRRVFVVGHLGNWHRAAAVLFERHSLQGHLAPSREKGQGTTANVEGSVELCGPLNARDYKDPGTDGMNRNSAKMVPVSATLCARKGGFDLEVETPIIASTLQANDGAKWGSNQWVDEGKAIVQPMAFPWQSALDPIGNPENLSGTLIKNQTMAVAQPVYGTDCYNGAITGDVAATMGTPGSSVNASGPTVMTAMQVRRLTPVECERLQGFPDNYTNIPWRKKEEAPDGPRYKALGNSMAVPCMKWIGQRIKSVIAHQKVQP